MNLRDLTVRYWTGRPVVYRCYDRAGRLLYIGQTRNAPDRLAHHQAYSPWFAEVARTRIAAFRTSADAAAAEQAAIRGELPLHNQRHVPGRDKRASRASRQLRPGGAELIRSLMDLRRMTVRELADLCGGPKHRSAIGHLLTGRRIACNAGLAVGLQDVLLGDRAGPQLFLPERHLRAVS